jgi:hypothetical protein
LFRHSLGFALLVASVFLIRGFVNVRNVSVGFKADHLFACILPLTATRYPDAKKGLLYNDVLPRLAAIPGVRTATGGYPLPMRGAYESVSVEIDGAANAAGSQLYCSRQSC